MSIIELIVGIAVSIITILGGIYWLFEHVFKIGKFTEHLENFEQQTNKNFNDIDKKFDKIDSRLDKINETIDNHSYSLLSIAMFLNNKFPGNKIETYMKKSPRQLTEIGKKILNLVDGEQFLIDNKEQLFKIMDTYHPKTKLDVQNVALTVLLYYTSTDAFNHIKDIIYDLPEFDTEKGKYELTLNDVCFVMSLPLRDMYIKEHNL